MKNNYINEKQRIKITLDIILSIMYLRPYYMIKFQEKQKYFWKTLSYAWLENFNCYLDSYTVEETYDYMIEYLKVKSDSKKDIKKEKCKNFINYSRRKNENN